MGRAKATLPGRPKYRDIRGRGVLEGVVARAWGPATQTRRCRHRAQMGSIVMPRARRNCSCTRAASGAAQQSQPGGARNNQPNRASALHTADFEQAKNQPLLASLTDEAYIRSGERQALSTPSTGEPAIHRLAGTYPYSSKQSNPALLRVIRLQLRCNPDPRRNVRTRFFHRICCQRGRWNAPLCKISF